MTEDEITQFVSRLEGVVVLVAAEANGAPEVAWGDSFFFYDPEGTTPENQRFPFATIVVDDYPGFDTASQLHRPGVFRLNVNVSGDTFRSRFGDPPGPTDVDFAALDQFMPHPVYGQQSWVSIINPGDANRAAVEAMLTEAHDRVARRHRGRNADQAGGDR